MQRTAAVGTSLQSMGCGHILVDEMKQVKKADSLNEFW
jgi:hypothetical protein